MRNRKRGIALILTLMIASILAIMAGAFMGMNESNIRLLSSVEIHNKALQAAQAGVEYAKMRMEQNADWGNPKVFDPKDAKLPDTPVFRVQEVVEGDDDQRGPLYKVVGVINGGESHFQMLFVDPTANNLTFYPLEGENGLFNPELIASNPLAVADEWGSTTCNNVDISVNYSAFMPSDPLLRLDPVSPPSYANATNRNIPPRRARVVVLGYCKGLTRRVEASFGPVELSDASLASGSDMAVSVSSNGKWTITSTDGENQVKTLGNFYGPQVTTTRQGIQFGDKNPGGSVRSSKDVFLKDGLKLTYNEPDDEVIIDNTGTALTATQRDEAGAAAHGEFIAGSSGATLPPVEPKDVENLANIADSNKRSIPAGRYEFTDSNTVTLYAPDGTTKTFTGAIPSDTGTGTAVVLRDGKFIVPNQTQVSVKGNLEIDSIPGLRPKVAIGFNSGGWLPDKATGVLSVAGDLTVTNGTVIGSGSVVASGDGNKFKGKVTIAGKSDMSADADVGITMYANSTVNITPPQAGTYQKLDFGPFKYATSGFAAGNWTSNKQMNSWGKLDIGDKAALAGKLSPTVVNDTQVTAANPATPGAIRTTDITADLGALGSSGSVLNTLVNEYQFVSKDPEAMANVTQIVTAWTAGEGNINGVPTTVESKGITTGRYLRLREFLNMNNEYLRDKSETEANPLHPGSWAWADVTDTETNSSIAYKVINQLDYYERQRDAYGSKDLQTFFTNAENPITSEAVDASFHGLIFANGNIFCDLGEPKDESKRGSFFLDGGMVARKSLAVANAKSVYTKYNPMYMKALTRELYNKKGWRRLSIVYWASF